MTSAAQTLHDAVEDLRTARKIISDLEDECRRMGNTGKLNTAGVIALYEVTKKLETLDDRVFNAINKLEG
jgi:hypothetical protein